MPFLFIYILKLSVSLAVVFLFYHFILRKLTFYNWNRWYLLGYSLLSFFIPFIDISPALHKNELTNATVVQWVPVFYKQADENSSISYWNIISLLVITGMLIMLTRLVMQLISFRSMRKKAQLISGEDIQLYQVNESIIPFSFGNAVFINRNLHTAEELEEIIRHEFVHVKQRHSIDIIFGELLCLFNWYNPFAWLIKSSIRQNLEFVADNKVLENGINRKQYQYLLLKVIGNNHFSIAQKFNFSSLKKRIAMMNKNKSTKMHLLRFLFLLPVLAVILVSFRKEIGDTLKGKQKQLPIMPGLSMTDNTDTIPDITDKNSRGYIISVKDNNGNCLLVIKDKNGREVKRILLTEWNKDAEKYEALYGELPPPPPPSSVYLASTVTERDFLQHNKDVKNIGWVYHYDNKVATVQLVKKDGSKETYNLDKETERAAFEKKYGSIPYLPPPPPSAPTPVEEISAPTPPAPPTPPVPAKLPENVKRIDISNTKVIVTLKNGEKENYDFSKPDQKAKFEKKYGDVVPGTPVPPASPSEVREEPVPGRATGTVRIASRTTNNLETVYVNDKQYVPSKKITGNPLIILDGEVLKDGDIRNVDPNTIASVDVLKGESATSAYGEKGMDGVIIIKSKTYNSVKQDVLITAKEVKVDSDKKNELVVNSPTIELNDSKQLVVLDGKELPADQRKLRGSFNVVTLTKEQAIKKYGDKGKNGVTELTTLK